MPHNEPLHLAVLVAVIVALLLVDLKLFARGREPTFKEGVWWSVGWLVLSLLAALAIWAVDGSEAAVVYTTVYLIERSLSLDNLFVFILLFTYFGIAPERRAPLLFWGIALSLALRGLAILGGSALVQQFHWVLYLLGALLLILALRLLRGVEESVDPEKNPVVRTVRRAIPNATPWVLALASIAFADIAFAIDSIPAAFAITTDPYLIFMGNAFALLGLRALFVLVEGLMRRLRFLDETIAAVLGLIAIKLLLQDVVQIGPGGSLALVAGVFTIGIVASLLGDRRESRQA